MILNIPFTVKYWVDKNGIHNIYCKKYEVSAYGNTVREAEKMFASQVYFVMEETTPKTNTATEANHPQY